MRSKMIEYHTVRRSEFLHCSLCGRLLPAGARVKVRSGGFLKADLHCCTDEEFVPCNLSVLDQQEATWGVLELLSPEGGD